MPVPSTLIALALGGALALAAGEDDLATRVTAALKVTPAGITAHQSVSFDEAGTCRGSDSQMSVSLLARFPGIDGLVGYRDLALTEALTDTGEKLQLRYGSNRRPIFSSNTATSLSLSLTFAPTTLCRSLVRLEGTFTALVATGPRRQVTLAPLDEWVVDQVAEIEGFAGGSLRLTRNVTDDQVTLECGSALRGLIDGVRFTDQNGVEIPSRSMGGGGNDPDSSFTLVFHVNTDRAAGVVVTFRPQLVAVPCAFALRDLPCRVGPVVSKPPKPVKPVDAAPPAEPANVRRKAPGDVDF
jgi:hypothetical protein